MKVSWFTALLFAAQANARVIGGQNMAVKRGSDGLQDIVSKVTYDENSLFIYGQRIMIFSGEFHAYRLPVPGLWLDVFQKVKALGFSAISFYTGLYWKGNLVTIQRKAFFALEPFFEAAQEAGLYLIARPGPYINAESSGGGFPGWLQRVKGKLRTSAPDYLASTNNYVASVATTIAKYQITNGGPVILLQPENEYSGPEPGDYVPFPDPAYFAYVEKQYRDAGIVVPLVSNDNSLSGYFAPGELTNGTASANVDIYGYDTYPLLFDCAQPTQWGASALPTDFYAIHEKESPSTFNSIQEFQGGSFDPWGGYGYDACAELLNMEFERVLYKNNYAARVSLMNAYMIFGGTNWGNLGYALGYTSYDYGAAISENREIVREKYSELKLQANFLKVTPAYLTASVGNMSNTTYTDNIAITVTPLFGDVTNFYIVRHSDYQTFESTTYKMTLSTSVGSVTVPQLGGILSLNGRDSKWAVTDYDMGGETLLYSTAEILTWKAFESQTVLVVYGGPGEQHELAIVGSATPELLEGDSLTTECADGAVIFNWAVSSTRRVVRVGNVLVYIVDRNSAYNYWTPDFPRLDVWGNYTANVVNTTSVIIEAGYLIRGVSLQDTELHVYGDFNATVPLKIIGAPACAERLYFNGKPLPFAVDSCTGEWSAVLEYTQPEISLPDFSTLAWSYIDNLPEISPAYDDSLWTDADHVTTNNPMSLLTPTSLYASDYGFNTGALLYRGHFIATGTKTSLYIDTQGGTAFGSSVYLNNTYLGSWIGSGDYKSHNDTYSLPDLVAGGSYVFTIVIDNNGLDEDGFVGADQMKAPRGILDYALNNSSAVIHWKLTGNLGGEDYIDKVRGPLNEGGLYAERQGYHQPFSPIQSWATITGGPLTGSSGSVMSFYTTPFNLSMPQGYDVPLYFVISNTTISSMNATANFQLQLYVNGWQFGKYINNVGPQTRFPVPEGILNYRGVNWLAIEFWSRDDPTKVQSRIKGLALEAGTPVNTGMRDVRVVDSPVWVERVGAY